jgi:hypothetical protein
MTTKQIEAYIEASTKEAFKEDATWKYGSFKYGMALTLLAMCMDTMTDKQKRDTFGSIEREAKIAGIFK